MKLYSLKNAPNPRRVRIFLAEKRVTLPIEEIEDVVTGAPVVVSPAVLADYDQRLEDEDVAAGANLLRLALTVPPMKITRAGGGA